MAKALVGYVGATSSAHPAVTRQVAELKTEVARLQAENDQLRAELTRLREDDEARLLFERERLSEDASVLVH